MQKNHKVHLHNSPIKLSYSVCNFIYCPKKIAHVQLFLTSISGCYHLTHKDLINIFASEVTSVYFGGASYKMQSEFMLTALGKSTIGGIFKNNNKQNKQQKKHIDLHHWELNVQIVYCFVLWKKNTLTLTPPSTMIYVSN